MLEFTNFKLKFLHNDFFSVDINNLSIEAGEIFALLGKSGCGKTLTALSILGLEPSNTIIEGQVKFKDQVIRDRNQKYPNKLRGKAISFIPQDPLSALNPLMKIGDQLLEAILSQTNSPKNLCLDLLTQVGIPDPELCFKSYPHELSGGMRQRVLIAMAIINKPDLIIADEPTTALDVTVQALILKLLSSLKQSILLISHDLGVVAEIADRFAIMEEGKIIQISEINMITEYSGGQRQN